MNKAISITISGLIFHIEEEAYHTLSAYLDEVRAHLGDSADKAEIMSDIEASIAEKFSEKISSSKEVISLLDVTELIMIMGSAEAFDEPSKESSNEGTDKPLKKLYRNPDDAIIAGVCSGIAAYFGIQAVLIRLLFFVSVLFGGAGIVVYIILWIIVPEAKTSSQKLEMNGAPVTLAAIEQVVMKNNERIKSSFRRLIEFPFVILKFLGNYLGKIVRALGPIISGLIGFAIFLGSLAGIASLSLVACTLIFNIQSPYIISDIPLTDIITEPHFKIVIISLYLIIVIPIIMLLLSGISLMRRKSSFGLALVGSLVGIWMAAIVAAGTFGFQYAPRIEEKINQYEAQSQTTRNFPLENFSTIEAKDNIKVVVTKGEKYSINAKGYKEEIERLNITLDSDKIIIAQSNRERYGFCLFCLSRSRPEITITMPRLSNYTGTDASILTASGFKEEEFSVILKDVARSEITSDFKKITIELSDAARLTLSSGTPKQMHVFLKANISDGARLRAYNFSIQEAQIKLSDAARAELGVENKLEASVSDVARLYYQGAAELIQKNSTEAHPAARVIKTDELNSEEVEE